MMSNRVLRALSSAIAKGNGKGQDQIREAVGKVGGDKGAGNSSYRRGGRFWLRGWGLDGRYCRGGGDTSGKGMENRA